MVNSYLENLPYYNKDVNYFNNLFNKFENPLLAKEFFDNILNYQPELRMTADKVIELPFFEDVKLLHNSIINSK